ncbi:MAG: hypothetical protein V3W34_14250 [Phycisphaerae bacterium]
MAKTSAASQAPTAPPVIEPLRRCARDVIVELGRAYDVIRTRAEESINRQAELTSRFSDVERRAAELNRLTAEFDERESRLSAQSADLERERQEVSNQRHQLAENLREAPAEGAAGHDCAGPVTFEAPAIRIAVPQPEAVPTQQEHNAAAKSKKDGTNDPGPKAGRFRKLRRDARRRIKSL